MTEQDEILVELRKDFVLDTNDDILSEKEILQQLSFIVSTLLQQNPEAFFQIMYRLDIPEQKLTDALTTNGDVVEKVSRLIYDRQLQKVRSRKNTSKPSSDDPELKW
ncbi:MAG TPA: hypothetical protein PL009_05870 [Flavipsychrobacter sp.]|nr:hypothetical protein [Flavipsychrobacter sp.]